MKQPQDWTDRARALLDASAQHLDGATVSRLNQARQRALAAQVQRGASGWVWSRRLALAASLALAAVMFWPDARNGANPAATASAALSPEDAELLADGALELTDEPEFYAWLDADDEHNG